MLERQLEAGLNQLGILVSKESQGKLLAHLDLLSRWNKAHNLTRINQKDDMIYFHTLDSLAISPYLIGRRFIDVGTGAGFPGIPLAIAHDDKDFILLDSNRKKVQFLMHVLSDLKINNVKTICSRSERYTPDLLFDGILIRAAASSKTILPQIEHLVNDDGRIYAMTARDFPLPSESKLKIEKTIPLMVPRIHDRKLIILKR